MIRLSRLADYGVVALTHIALRPGRLFTAADLAAETGLPGATVGKLLKQFCQAGIVLSHRGAKGGYALSRPPERISMRDIVTAVDGPIALTDCAGADDSACHLETLCPTSSAWKKINATIAAALGDLSLADLARPGHNFPPVGAPAPHGPARGASAAPSARNL